MLTWLGLISYSLYLLHPMLIEVYRFLPWTARHYSLWPQLLIDALFLAILIALCSLTYLFVERPMQNAGRRLARWFDARFGPDQPAERFSAASSSSCSSSTR
jgi:peptidoglycan/LPS O-acetylase OafA/YrhL